VEEICKPIRVRVGGLTVVNFDFQLALLKRVIFWGKEASVEATGALSSAAAAIRGSS